MGNREDLLAGAQQCLREKGYARTTARDIAAASGVSLASIGYHFGSTDALLRAAMMATTHAWSEELERALTPPEPAARGDRDKEAGDSTPAGSLGRFEANWTRVLESFADHRSLWATQFEMVARLEHDPEFREFFAEAIEGARFGLAALFEGLNPGADRATAWKVGAFYDALLIGLLVQWLADADRAPTGRDLADALRLVAAGAARPPEKVSADRPNAPVADAGQGPRTTDPTDTADTTDSTGGAAGGADLARWEAVAGPGSRCEWVDGSVLITPPAGAAHDRTVAAYAAVLTAAAPKGWRVATGPGVLVPDGRLRPDLAVFTPRADEPAEWSAAAEVGLVVEVEGDRAGDLARGTRALKYARAGIPAYWRIEPDGTVVVSALVAPDHYGIVARVAAGEPFTAAVPYAVTFTPDRPRG
ncbi:DNA-binding transcriptional regulator, AcrR family [Actinopolymorpha cephalotaxi]|uniref:AcrR family transcriptional regulator/Uma2 family endonuclease n=1 Tax=Actinopolymorpha cephalotaxi TaxID=504797 RepID=A0A1I2PWB7_9ACTN|nr:Uma2 family endonuclease [Actinopolymorpha cephalotaxi]NYH83514.1 AcrR family transcriptional regulator/Uma2 family endonuclease [Actinopolymorpha cephalotaxi]SFG18297.1 DNA-binding transcriptional regulator, AcrR family [Actinopolymorpha cephalotaxi]